MNNQSKKELQKAADYIHEKGMSIPFIFFLESTKYISFIASQFMHACGPVITSFINGNRYYNIADLLEDRDNIEFLIKMIEKNNLIKQSR